MKNPYEILGIPENASDEQIKAAYRELARKYQSDDDASSRAQNKMREIDEAYDNIILNRSRSGGRDESSYQRQTEPDYTDSSAQYDGLGDIRAKIKSNRLDDAETLLDGIPPTNRSAEWYYLKGTVQQRHGWLEEALKNLESAVNMDPNNREYRAALNNIQSSRFGGYRQSEAPQRNRRSGDCGFCDMCSGLLCADCCCECMGGDLIPCC